MHIIYGNGMSNSVSSVPTAARTVLARFVLSLSLNCAMLVLCDFGAIYMP